jgi:hypothetical protein
MPQALTTLPLCPEIYMIVHIDIFDFLTITSNGKKYIWVATDAFSNYAEILLCGDIGTF